MSEIGSWYTDSFKGFLWDSFWFSGAVRKSRLLNGFLTFENLMVFLIQESEYSFHWNLRFNRKPKKAIKTPIKDFFPETPCKCSDNSIKIGLSES